MKTIIYLFSGLILLLGLIIGVAIMNLSSIVSYAVAKFTNGEVHVSKADIAYKTGIIIADLSDVQVKKKIDVLAKNCRLVIGIDKGLYLKQVSVSDFEASVPTNVDLSFLNTSEKPDLFPVPQELIEIKRGIITYDGQRIAIDKVVVNNLKGKKPFSFELRVQNEDLFGKLEASGEGGPYKGLETGAKGKLSVTALNLNKLADVMQGKARIDGTFTFEKRRFFFEGPFRLLNYVLKDRIFRNPFSVAEANGKFSYAYANDMMDIKIRGGKFKEVPLGLDLMFKNDKLAMLELTSGLLDVEDVKEIIALDKIAETEFKFWNYVGGGKVRIKKFVYGVKKRSNADLELEKATVSYDDMQFTDVEGKLSFDDKELRTSDVKGSYKTSSFYNVSGTVPFAKGKDITARGDYAFNMHDIPSLPQLGEITFNMGETEGTMEVEGNSDIGYKIEGTGKLSNADITWRNQSLSAKGVYNFNNDGIAFDPLVIDKGQTNIAIKGRWDKKSIDMQLKGSLDIDHVKPFISIPFDVNGITGLDLMAQQDGDIIKVDGDISMDGLFFEIPGFVRKDKGIKSGASLTIRKGPSETRIERLLYNLDIIDVKAKGDVQPDKTVNMDLAVDVSEIGKIAHLFYFDEEMTGGTLELNLSLRDLHFPLKKLPHIDGYAKINNGFLRLPWISKPLKEINLTSDFKGEKFNISVSRLKCGTSVLNSGTLRLEGLEAPHFSLYVDMGNLDFDDFRTQGDTTVLQIDESSLLAKAGGDIHLRAKKLHGGSINGEYLDMKGLFSSRKLNVSEFKMNVFDGNVDMLGSIDLSESIPRIYVNGGLNRTRSGLFLKAFGAKTELAQGRSSFYGQMDSKGKTIEELAGNANGNAALYSRNGSILKWNLLSKILGFLNIYDSLRGKASLGKEGLPYTKMGATFVAKNGVFSTKDFLIDSPSMVITGDGSMDLKKDLLDGNITVSPLVTLDRTIDKIPILRNILQGKGKGFLYVAYKVKGPMDDPDISVSFVNTIGGKALDILRNILVLPKELLEGM